MSKRLAGCALLIVEDEFLILLDLQYILESEGATVVTAASLSDGLAATHSEYAAAILDVRLPDGDIFPVAESLERLKVPMLFHSGHAKADDLFDRFPNTPVLSKPVPEKTLVETVARLISDNRAMGGTLP